MPDSILPMPATLPLDESAEAALVQSARRGDYNAFGRLYREHARSVYALAWRLTGDAGTAEDIVQETFLRMFRFIGGLRPGMPVRPWLRQVAARLAVDRLRRTWRDLPDGDAGVSGIEPGAGPDTYSEALGLLQHLSPLARSVVWLNQMEGWSHQELAQRFGRSESWSKSLVSRSLARLREHAASTSFPLNEDTPDAV